MITTEINQESSNLTYLNLSNHGRIIKIPMDSILYVESNKRKVTIYTETEHYMCYEKLNTIEQLLGKERFIRCHQSYLVQSNKILSFNSNHTISLDQTTSTIPVSRRHQQELRQLLCNPITGGTLVCLTGPYKNSIIKIKSGQRILIGRDGAVADLIINLPLVSRKHCEMIYHEDSRLYELTDFSTNGTYVNGRVRLVPYEPYTLKPGSTICFGDKETIYQLN